jgi:hypothetical protein
MFIKSIPDRPTRGGHWDPVGQVEERQVGADAGDHWTLLFNKYFLTLKSYKQQCWCRWSRHTFQKGLEAFIFLQGTQWQCVLSFDSNTQMYPLWDLNPGSSVLEADAMTNMSRRHGQRDSLI